MARKKVGPPTAAPAPEEYLRVTGELIDLWMRGEKLTVNHRKTRAALLTHSLVAHVIESARAARLLIDQGYPTAAVANIRVAWEYAATAQWISANGDDGIERFLTEVDRKAITWFHDSSAVLDHAPDIIQHYKRLNQEIDRSKALPPFVEQCRQFGEPWLYLQYRALSEYAHPSQRIADGYLEQVDPDAGVLGVALRHQPDIDTRAYEFTLAWAVVLAVFLYEDMRKTKPHKAKVIRAATALGLPYLLKSLTLAREHPTPRQPHKATSSNGS